jgi:hypothetical protein
MKSQRKRHLQLGGQSRNARLNRTLLETNNFSAQNVDLRNYNKNLSQLDGKEDVSISQLAEWSDPLRLRIPYCSPFDAQLPLPWPKKRLSNQYVSL